VFFLLGLRSSLSSSTPASTSTPKPKPKPKPKPQAEPTHITTPASTMPVQTTTTAVPASYSAPAFPQTTPAGLPPFPSNSWTPDVPVGPGVASRAMALLPELWRSGPGTFKCEQTAGRWICYRAVQMGNKRGVVAYREARPSGPSSSIVPASTTTSTTSPVGLPTLRMGMKGPDVVTLQTRLHLLVDGDFGPKTRAGVMNFQVIHGLTPDGIVGPATWGALFARPA
jgi:Putative peptidoglycan binding domain